MNKIGEGKNPAQKPSIEQYHRELDTGTTKFVNALEKYQTSSGEEKLRLKGVMDDQLSVIRSAVNELKRAGIHKQEAKVEDNYRTYIQDENSQNLAALQHNLTTLRDYNDV